MQSAFIGESESQGCLASVKVKVMQTVVFRCLLFFAVFRYVRVTITVWGPGLQPEDIVLPARYFFIQSDVENLRTIEIQFAGENFNGFHCRVRSDRLFRNSSSLIVRYRLYETCYKFKISVKLKDEFVADSPWSFERPIYHESCNCNPADNLDTFLDQYQCKTKLHSHQIDDDLQFFKSINITDAKIKALKRFSPESSSFCHYKVLYHQVYRKCYGKYVGFSMFMDSFLTSLTRLVHLPNLDMLVNLGDWPLVSKKWQNPIPMLSWCGSVDTYDIVMPTYDLMESSMEALGRVELDMLSMQGNIKMPWNQKIEKLFWRGRDSNENRLTLIDISRRYPDLFNVSLTNFFFYRDKIDEYGPKVPYVPFFEFFNNKYQINIDGTVAAYRFPYLLAGDSLVFKQSSKYYEYFYRHLTPGFHYVDVRRDLSNLMVKLRWAINNDLEAKNIAENAMKFARDNLLPHDVYCYMAQLLNEYSKNIVEESKMDIELDLVSSQKVNNGHECDCNKFRKTEL